MNTKRKSIDYYCILNLLFKHNYKMKTLVKKGKKIIGFTYQKPNGEYYFAFGKPSQSSWIEFQCKSIEDGINKINNYSKI